MTVRRGLGLVWAQSADGIIGLDGTLPWHLPEDLAHFRALTTGHPVVMGRTTWQSLPPRFRPLPGRANIVLSRDRSLVLEGARTAGDVGAALEILGHRPAWVIGGAQVYAAFLPFADRLEVTEVNVVIGRGTPAPPVGQPWAEAGREPSRGWALSTTGLRYRFVRWDLATGRAETVATETVATGTDGTDTDRTSGVRGTGPLGIGDGR